MGNFNQPFSNEIGIAIYQYNWKPVQSLGYCMIVQDYIKKIRGQLYNVPSYDYQTQMKILQYRKNKSAYVVKIYSAIPQESNYLCSHMNRLNIVTQRIPYRYSDLENVEFKRGLFILNQALHGAKQISKQLKGVHYDDNMICFTQSQQIKMWINENLALNYQRRQQQISHTSLQQQQIVYQLFTIIQNRICQIPKEYYEEKNLWNLLTFDVGLKFVALMRKQCIQKENQRKSSIKANHINNKPINKIINNHNNKNDNQRSYMNQTKINHVHLIYKLNNQLLNNQQNYKIKNNNILPRTAPHTSHSLQSEHYIAPIQSYADKDNNNMNQQVMNILKTNKYNEIIHQILNRELIADKLQSLYAKSLLTQQINPKLSINLQYQEARKNILRNF